MHSLPLFLPATSLALRCIDPPLSPFLYLRPSTLTPVISLPLPPRYVSPLSPPPRAVSCSPRPWPCATPASRADLSRFLFLGTAHGFRRTFRILESGPHETRVRQWCVEALQASGGGIRTDARAAHVAKGGDGLMACVRACVRARACACGFDREVGLTGRCCFQPWLPRVSACRSRARTRPSPFLPPSPAAALSVPLPRSLAPSLSLNL